MSKASRTLAKDGRERAAARLGVVFAALGGELFAEPEARALRGMSGGAVLVAAAAATALLHKCELSAGTSPQTT